MNPDCDREDGYDREGRGKRDQQLRAAERARITFALIGRRVTVWIVREVCLVVAVVVEFVGTGWARPAQHLITIVTEIDGIGGIAIAR